MRIAHRRLALAFLVAVTPSAVPFAAFAQGPTDAATKAAHARFNEGVEFFDKHEYENARTSFLQAYALRKHPAVLINLAQSSLRAGHTLEADHYFQQYLRGSTGLTAMQKSEAESGLAEARTKLARLQVSAPTGADVSVDGASVGAAPLTDSVDVEPGAHTLKAAGDVRSVTVTAGQVTDVRFGGGPPAPVPVPVPVSPADVPPPATPEPAPPAPEPPPPPQESHPGIFSAPANAAPMWVGVAVSAAGFATAIVFGVFKGNAQDNYNSLVTEISSNATADKVNPHGLCVNPPAQFASACSQLNTNGNNVNADATVANVGIAVGVIGAAFSAGWFLFAPKREKKPDAAPTTSAFPTVDVSPMVGFGSGGLRLSGSF